KELTGDKEFKGGAGIDTLKTKVDLEKVALRKSQEDELASIIYTSGTTGEPKGVMLSNKNLTSNAAASVRQFFRVRKGMQFLSILPLAHTYEFTIGFLLPLLCGCHIHYLNRPPSPSVLLPAMKRVRPHVMLSVPLLIERIYKNSVLAKIEKSERLSKLYKRPLFRVFINRMVGRQLRSTFGGRLKFFGVGGAPLEYECEKFLKEARFPYAIGYGLTETSPLLAGAGPKQTKVGTIGYPLKGVSLKMGEDGEILAKGPNVMVGYYNQEELTQDSFTADGWFKTGDLGEMDKGRLTIKGRSKTMILGPSGENIYPELIEQLLNNQPYVEESLVIEGEEGLVAMIKINFELMGEHLKMSLADAKESAAAYLNKLRKDVNWQLSSHSHIRVVELQEEPFKRTPTLKIKRYLYALRGGIKE
ncbi:MAG: long-chain fatty acid--CoA ligase, partial [Spirochaetales bacterium]|nr:long-chain fatty acid--CoA ligase [Spirochaetales bacterium]